MKSLKAFSVGINSLPVEKSCSCPRTFADAVLAAGMLLFLPGLPWGMPAHSQILPQAPLGFLLYLVSVLYFLSPKLLYLFFILIGMIVSFTSFSRMDCFRCLC